MLMIFWIDGLEFGEIEILKKKRYLCWFYVIKKKIKKSNISNQIAAETLDFFVFSG